MSSFPKSVCRKAAPASHCDGVADGYEAFALVRRFHGSGGTNPCVRRRRGQSMPANHRGADLCRARPAVLELPAGTVCLDRVSPGSDAAASGRCTAAMTRWRKSLHRAFILTTANALMQRSPPADWSKRKLSTPDPGRSDRHERVCRGWRLQAVRRDADGARLANFSVRGGILDLYAPG